MGEAWTSDTTEAEPVTLAVVAAGEHHGQGFGGSLAGADGLEHVA